MKEELTCEKYLRYVDDFALFSDDRDYLVYCRQMIESYLADLRLKIHPIKSQLFATQIGMNFVGFRILPVGESNPLDIRIRVRNDNLRRSRHRMRVYQNAYGSGEMTLDDLIQRLQSWEAHLFHGNTYGLRQDVFKFWVFCRPTDFKKPKKVEKSRKSFKF